MVTAWPKVVTQLWLLLTSRQKRCKLLKHTDKMVLQKILRRIFHINAMVNHEGKRKLRFLVEPPSISPTPSLDALNHSCLDAGPDEEELQ